VQNDGDECFTRSVLSVLHLVDKYPKRMHNYKKWENELDEALNGTECLVKLSDVSEFVNRTNIYIKVFC
jgi:hypothetical protein